MPSPALLAVFAHPDDEAFRCGGTLALLARGGVRVHLLTFTPGQAGSCGDPPLCTPEELGVVRTDELHCSCRALGIEDLEILDYEDGELSNVHHEEGVAHITARIHSIRPQALLTWPSTGLSGHPDHIAVSQWAEDALQTAINSGIDSLSAMYYLAFPQSLARDLGLHHLHSVPAEEVTMTVDVRDVWEQKMTAIACHRTQAGSSPILKAPEEHQRRFLGWEHFKRVSMDHLEDALLKLDRQQEELTTE